MRVLLPNHRPIPVSLNTFHAPRPSRRLIQLLGGVNDAIVLPHVARIRKIHLPEADAARLHIALKNPTVICPNHPEFFTASGPLRGIKRSMTDGGIRVPFIARWPGKIKAGTVSDHIGYFGDMMATWSELAGGKTPAKLDSIIVNFAYDPARTRPGIRFSRLSAGHGAQGIAAAVRQVSAPYVPERPRLGYGRPACPCPRRLC